jgi:hypothetical protein
MHSIIRISLLIVFCTHGLPSRAANDTYIATSLASSYGRLRALAGEQEMAESDRFLFVDQEPALVYTGIYKYLNHTNVTVRCEAVGFLGGLVMRGKGQKNPVLQKEYVKAALRELGEDLGLRHGTRRSLQGIPYSVFDDELKLHIRSIHKAEGLNDYVIALYDIAGMQEYLPVLKSNLVSIARDDRQEKMDPWRDDLQWHVCRVLAKWGDGECITNYVRKCQSMASVSNRGSIYNVRLLREIRVPLAVQALTNTLFSNYKPQVAPNHLSGGSLANHSAQSLSEMVVDFPVSRYQHFYSDEEVDVCRKWVLQQTNFVIKPSPSYSQDWGF